MADPYVWIMAGEPSGDAYGAEIAKELRRRTDGKIRLAGMGSAKMREAGIELITDSAELGVMGFWEVFKMAFTFLRVFTNMKRRALAERPDAVVLIDYPGFNLRFAKQMHKHGIPVVYYISPKVWAWGKGRIPTLAQVCDKLLCIFPFEVDFFKGTGVRSEFVGHPLVKMLREKIDPSIERDPDTFLMLPGSRKNEIKYMMRPMFESAQKIYKRHPNLKFVVAATNPKIERQIRAVWEKFSRNIPENERLPLEIRVNETYYWIQRAGTALATSGTVTVECAIMGLPLVSIYASSTFNFTLAKLLVKLYRDFFTMPNIILDKCLFEEYMQMALHHFVLVPAIERILPGGERRDYVIREMKAMSDMLAADDAFANAAEAILDTLRSKKAETEIR